VYFYLIISLLGPEMVMGPNFLIQPNPTHPPLSVHTILLWK